MITNDQKIPQALVRAIENDPYDSGPSDYSVTTLLKPPRALVLERQHKDEIREEALSKIWALLGQSVHAILERSARPDLDLVETRFFAAFDDKIISAQIDLYERDTKTLSDFKITKSYPFTIKGGQGQKPEWIFQMNTQAELMRRRGFEIKKLQIIAILKDFNAQCANPSHKMFMPGYPKREVQVVDIPILPPEKIISQVKERIQAHEQAKKVLPSCTPVETWGGNRCRSYCAAMPFCLQYKNALTTGRLSPF